jgi:hypothetical protein
MMHAIHTLALLGLIIASALLAGQILDRRQS